MEQLKQERRRACSDHSQFGDLSHFSQYGDFSDFSQLPKWLAA